MQPIPDKTDLPRWHDLGHSTVKLAFKKNFSGIRNTSTQEKSTADELRVKTRAKIVETQEHVFQVSQAQIVSIDVVADELSGRISIRKAKNGLLGRVGDMI